MTARGAGCVSCARPDLMRGLGSNAQAYATLKEELLLQFARKESIFSGIP